MNHFFDGESTLKRSTAILLLAVTAMLWSLGGVLVKLVSWNPMAIAGMRSIIAALTMLIILRKPRFTWSFPQIGGAICCATTVLTFIVSTKLTTAANAVILEYTAPVFVALLGIWFLKEKIGLFDWITVILVMGGIILFFLDKISTGGIYGNLLAILGGISFAGLFIFMRKQKNDSTLETVLLGNVIVALAGVPFMFRSMPGISSWGGLVLLGVLQLGIPYVLYAVAIKRVNALEAVLTATLEPILNPIWVFMAIGEKPGFWSIVGGTIVLVSVTARNAFLTGKGEVSPKKEIQYPVEA